MPGREAEGVKRLRVEGGTVVFGVASGQYSFVPPVKTKIHDENEPDHTTGLAAVMLTLKGIGNTADKRWRQPPLSG